MKILLYGGSFDPVHPDHLEAARGAHALLGLVPVFQISRKARWKHPDSDPEDRLEILRRVLSLRADFPYEIDDSLIKDPALPDFTVEVLRRYRGKYPGAELHFLLGGDSVNTFPRWKEAREIAATCRLHYVERPGLSVDASILNEFGIEPLRGVKTAGYSSTAIRGLGAAHPYAEAREYIQTRRMYYAKTVSSYLSGSRYEHSVRVAELARTFLRGTEADLAYIAGMAHDIAKELPIGEQKKLAAEYDPGLSKEYPDWVYHQFAGAALSRKTFPLMPKEAIRAIAGHCTGSARMDDVAKAVYAADKIEPGRGYDSKWMIDLCRRDIKRGFETVLRENIKFLHSRGYSCEDKLTRSTIREYLKGE